MKLKDKPTLGNKITYQDEVIVDLIGGITNAITEKIDDMPFTEGMIVLSGIIHGLLDYREEFTSVVIISAIIIKVIINLSIFMITDKIRTKWISKLILILWVVLVECLYIPIHLSYLVLLCVSGGIVLIEHFKGKRNPI